MSAAESNYALSCGGFVPNSKTGQWTPPTIRSFEHPDEVWAYYKDKGTPEQRAKLLELLAQWPSYKAGGQRIKRRA
jgi:hypothetical protein